MDVNEALKGIGLSEKEVKIYLICLRSGTVNASRAAELTKLPKSTCYDILNSLVRKGLCSSIIKEKVMYFEAADPNALLAAVEEQRKELKEILPKLNAIRKSLGIAPKIEMFKGKAGMKAIYDDVLKTGKEYLVLGNHEKFSSFYRWFGDIFIKQRAKKGIRCRYIAEKSKLSSEVKKRDRQELRETRISEHMNEMDAECYVFGNKVAFVVLSKQEPFGILIENKDVAKLQRMLFDNLWEKS